MLIPGTCLTVWKGGGPLALRKFGCSKKVLQPEKIAWDYTTRQQSSGRAVAMINRNRWGHSNCAVRGEILGSAQVELMRKLLSRRFSLIKNESWGIEDDQIPS